MHRLASAYRAKTEMVAKEGGVIDPGVKLVGVQSQRGREHAPLVPDRQGSQSTTGA